MANRLPTNAGQTVQVHRIAPLVAAIVIGLGSFPIHAATASGTGGVTVRSAHAAKPVRQGLFMNPHCFVSGRRASAHVTLTHTGPHARVEFIWAPKTGIFLGPGFGPGIFRSNAVGVVRFVAVSPSYYGRGAQGTWVLAAEWPKAEHAFVRTTFRVVADAGMC